MRIHDYLEYFSHHTPKALFATFGDVVITFAEADARADQIAGSFASIGLNRGDRAALLSTNCLEHALLYYGAFKAGVVLVPLNYRLAGPELVYIVNDAGAKAIICRNDLVEVVDAVAGDMSTVETRIALDADAPEGWKNYDDWISGGCDLQPQCSNQRSNNEYIDDGNDAYIMYTSGTTGHPKGAVLTHRSVCSNLTQFSVSVQLDQDDRYLIVAPLYHAAAAISLFATIAQGAAAVIHEEFEPAAVVDALETDVNGGTLVPAMIQACLVAVPNVAERNYKKLRQIIYGASPIAEATLRRAIEVFGCEFAQGYGMTETTAVLTILPWDAHQRALNGEPRLLLSAGKPLLGTELRIVDEQDNELPRGQVGEIVVRGPQLMRCYLNNLEATRRALRGGWMHTGDAGILDEEGFVFIQDRVKDMVVTGAENVYPREVEEVLFQHPAVADVAVIGVPSEQWGESLLAVVVTREGEQTDTEALVEFCRDKLAGYKIPRSVEFVDSLPRNPSGKVLKRQLREPYWAGKDRHVG